MQHQVLFSVLLSAAAAIAQTVTIPNGTAQVAAPGNMLQPWGIPSSFPPSLGSRIQTIYGAANFTSQGHNTPIRITHLRWRYDEATTTAPQATFGNATVRLSTSLFAWNTSLPAFSNHGPDVTTVYSGSVARQAFAGTWSVQSHCVDLQLSTPFDYDPLEGDLVVDVDLPGPPPFAPNGGWVDAAGAGTQARSVSATTTYPLPINFVNAAPVLELAYTQTTDYSWRRRLGAGCNPGGDQPFYEHFAIGAFDLANTSLSLLHGGSGYRVERGTRSLRLLTYATMLNLIDDQEIVLPLTSGAIPYGSQGNATSLAVSSNGVVAVASVGSGYPGQQSNPPIPTFLSMPATSWCGLWHDFDPSLPGSGQIWWEETPSSVFVTWWNVASYNAPFSASTFQIQLEKPTGNVHFVYGSIGITREGLVGFCEGGNSPNPGPTDLSVTPPFARMFVGDDIALGLSARPVLGTQLDFTTTNLPRNHPIGALVLGTSGYDQGLPLAAIGMPGCLQHSAADVVQAFVPVASAVSQPLALPANPAFSGMLVYAQSVVLQPYANPLGAITSNGWRLVLGTH